MNADKTITSKRLSEALSLAGMRAQELADRSGVGKASISQYLSGYHSPSNISAGKMAKVLGVDPLWLMGFDVPMNKTADENNQYYINPETARIAQQIYDDPDLHALFDAASDSDPEDMQMAADLLKRLKKTNPDG